MLRASASRDQSADFQVAGFFLDVVETGNVIDVDQPGGPRDAKLHHRDQALAAAQDLGVVAVLLQERDSFGNGSAWAYSNTGGIIY